MQTQQAKTLSTMMREMNARFDGYFNELKPDQPATNFEDVDWSGAMKSGYLAAVQKAYQTGTNLVVWRGDKMVEITPEEAEAEWLESRQKDIIA